MSDPTWEKWNESSPPSPGMYLCYFNDESVEVMRWNGRQWVSRVRFENTADGLMQYTKCPVPPETVGSSDEQWKHEDCDHCMHCYFNHERGEDWCNERDYAISPANPACEKWEQEE